MKQNTSRQSDQSDADQTDSSTVLDATECKARIEARIFGGRL